MLTKVSIFIAAFLVFQVNGSFLSIDDVATTVNDFVNQKQHEIENLINEFQKLAEDTIEASANEITNQFTPLFNQIEEIRNSVLDDHPKLKCVDDQKELLYNIPKNMTTTAANCAVGVIKKPIDMAKATIASLSDFTVLTKTATASYNNCATLNVICKTLVLGNTFSSFATKAAAISAQIAQITTYLSSITMRLEYCLVPVGTGMITDAIKYINAARQCV